MSVLNELANTTLLQRLTTANVVCHDCGAKHGIYSVGCSSTRMGVCGVCRERKPITETRDYGYLAKGIANEKAKIRKQSKEVADYMASPLSSAAQIVYDAFNRVELYNEPSFDTDRRALAAAIRKLAASNAYEVESGGWYSLVIDVEDIYDIADELEKNLD